MKRSTVLKGSSVALLLPVALVFAACADLQGGAGATETTATTVVGMVDETASQSTAAVSTTVTVAATTSTAAPATTTSTLGGSTSTPMQLAPGVFQVKPDAVKIDSNLLLDPTRYEDIHPYLHWEGSWHTHLVSDATAGTYRASQVAGSYVEVFFKGTGVRLIATKGIQGGKLRIVLTGNGISRVETISLYSPTTVHQANVWYSGHLANADYAVYMEHDTSNVGFKVVWIDAIDIWGTITPP